MLSLVKQFFLIDGLSLFFLAVIFAVSIACAVYSLGYLKTVYSRKKIVFSWFLLAFFVAAMALVVLAGNLILFLVAWEIMSLVSYFFVIFDSAQEKSVKAGMIYLVMTQIGTAFLIAAFLVLYNYAHSFDYASIKTACLTMPLPVKNTVFILFLIGFGTKAGIVPLHLWLPYAHPQAPSHISGIMSGVMIKTAVYGMIRFIFFLMGVDASWWGILVVVVGLISCLVGVLYALMEHDLKRLLAYHSVENVGIILLGIGLSMYFAGMHLPYLAVFSMMAGLYHLLNHAVFKSLLFLCAGSIYKATGTRDMEKLGGLIKQMPQTAVYFLIGSMAISALPPFNGFVSEWLTLQAFFAGALQVPGAMKLFLGAAAAALALTGGLAAACFVKAFGVTFLAQARSSHAMNVKEAPFSMKAGMFSLCFFTIFLGLAAQWVVKILGQVAQAASGITLSQNELFLNLYFRREIDSASPGTILTVPLLALILAATGLVGYAAYVWGRKGQVGYKTWDCGYYKTGPRNEYTATAFSKPFRIAFSFFLLPYRKTQKIRESFYHVKSFSYQTHTTQIFKKYVYDPALNAVMKLAKSMRQMQPGSIHLYLSYIFLTLIFLLIFLKKF